MAFGLGILFSRALNLPAAVFLVPAAGALAASVFLARAGRERTAWLLGFAAAGALGAARMAFVPPMPLAFPALGEKNSVIEGTIDEEPALSASRSTTVFMLAADRIRPAGDGWQEVRGRVRVKLQWADPALAYGDRLRIKGALMPPSGPSNPGQSDFRETMQRRNALALVTAWKPGDVRTLSAGGGSRARAALLALRRAAGNRLRKLVPSPQSELLASIVFGIQSGDFSEELLDAYRATGLMHILVASGLNVGLLAWLCLLLFGVMGAGRPRAAVLTVPVLIVYLLMCGAQPPLLRSTLMFILIVMAHARGRNGSAINAMGICALLILLVSPGSLWDRSFQFSFAATFSILMLVPWFSAHRGGVSKILAETAACTAAAQLALIPFLAASFGSLPFLGIFANLLVTPFMALFLAGGILLLTLGWIPPLGLLMGAVLKTALSAVTVAVEWFANLPLAMVVAPAFSPAALAAYLAWYAGLLGWAASRPAGIHVPLWPRAASLAGAAMMAALAWTAALAPRPGNLAAAFLDVGEGLGIVIRLPSGRAILMDAGTEFAGGAVVGPFLKQAGIGRLAGVILTHGHADHAGGLLAVIRMTRPDFVLITGAPAENDANMREILRHLARRKIPCRIISAGMRIEGEPGVLMTVISPPAGFIHEVPRSHFTDENSAVLSLEFGATTLILTGDIKSRAEAWLAARMPVPPPGVLLQVPHHGSAYASTRALLSATAPGIAVASCGARNRFGHPRPAVIIRYRDHGVRLHRTDREGAVLAVSDGRAWKCFSFGAPPVMDGDGAESPSKTAKNAPERCEIWKGKI